MQGWILVKPPGLKTAAQLGKWIDVATKFVAALPAK